MTTIQAISLMDGTSKPNGKTSGRCLRTAKNAKPK